MSKFASIPAPTDRWNEMFGPLGIDFSPGAQMPAASRRVSMQPDDLFAPQGDGQRTASLTRIAGYLLRHGHSLDITEAMCQSWNATNQPPLDQGKITATCASIARSEARNHPDRHRHREGQVAQVGGSGPFAPLFDIAEARISRFLSVPPPPRRWVLENFLPLGIVGAVVAPGGSSKSQFLMQLAYSVATGLPLAGHWGVGEQGTVLMLCAEDAEEEIHRRVHRMHDHVGLHFTPEVLGALKQRLLIRSVVGLNVLLTETGDTREVKATEVLQRLIVTAKQAPDLKLIIIDPASRFRGGDENSNADATRFVQALELLAQETGATVLIAHHAHKGVGYANTEPNQNASRGASALVDGIRWMMTLQPSKSASKAQSIDRRFVEAVVVKTNYTAPPASVLLQRVEGGYLEAVFNTPGVNAVNEPLGQLLALVKSAPGKLSIRAIETLHGGQGKGIGLSQRKTRELLADAVANQWLEFGTKHLLTLTSAGAEHLQAHPPLNPRAECGAARAGSRARRAKSQ